MFIVVAPSRRHNATRGEPSFAIVFGDSDCARTKFDDRGPFADGDHAFKVTHRAAHPLGELLFRDYSAHVGDSFVSVSRIWARSRLGKSYADALGAKIESYPSALSDRSAPMNWGASSGFLFWPKTSTHAAVT
jgi:hypothetical protein